MIIHFLGALQDDGLIIKESKHNISVITIVRYADLVLSYEEDDRRSQKGDNPGNNLYVGKGDNPRDNLDAGIGDNLSQDLSIEKSAIYNHSSCPEGNNLGNNLHIETGDNLGNNLDSPKGDNLGDNLKKKSEIKEKIGKKERNKERKKKIVILFHACARGICRDFEKG